jgi:RimJ/RimL family protein N-acetyltransferase
MSSVRLPVTPVAIPAIDTARLTLRGHRLEDLEDVAAMWGDSEVVRHIGGRPFTHEESWSRLLRYVGHWALLGFGFWVVREKATGRFVGEVGFADFKRDMEPSLDGLPEAGWVLAPWAHGQGYASEAVGAALTWADANFGGRGLACIIDLGNVASIRVAAKAGFREVARSLYKGDLVIVFRR